MAAADEERTELIVLHDLSDAEHTGGPGVPPET
jgi:hypothetical protein